MFADAFLHYNATGEPFRRPRAAHGITLRSSYSVETSHAACTGERIQRGHCAQWRAARCPDNISSHRVWESIPQHRYMYIRVPLIILLKKTEEGEKDEMGQINKQIILFRFYSIWIFR